MTTITDHELKQIERANSTGLTPVVFVHGLWLLPSSWDEWRTLFEENGFATIAPGWPDDPETVGEAREHPEVFARKSIGAVTSHYLEAIAKLGSKPALVGHSFGGVIAQKLAGDGASRATVAIDPAPFQGVLPLPVSSLRSSSPVLANPANFDRAVTLTFEQFAYGWANALDEQEAREIYERYHVAAPGRPLFSAATANFNPWSDDKVDTTNPDRGPLLLISGADDHTVPWAIVNASYNRQKRNVGVTEIVSIPHRGHSLTIDSGWEDVAKIALDFVNEHTAG
ncbi:alpha/beta hydrolase [Lacisediminihabitans sp.]|uniref:alpha/beta hydrolase n=1 Tax=Lacisediminihabitans sp. TaxID=2787631 RepID=UPI00374CB85E